MTWPPRWTGSQFKGPTQSAKGKRALKAKDTRRDETKNKAKVRRRDRECRFPLCPCGKLGYATHVSHSVHKGMAGNPAGDRSQAELMVLVCQPRHQGAASIDAKTIRWRPLTEKGASGPIAWDLLRHHGPWFELARETDIRKWEPFTPEQRQRLQALAKEMIDAA